MANGEYDAGARGPALERNARTMTRDMESMMREERRRELSEEPQPRRRLMGLPRGRQAQYTRGGAGQEQVQVQHLRPAFCPLERG